jgi:hypothetical protein
MSLQWHLLLLTIAFFGVGIAESFAMRHNAPNSPTYYIALWMIPGILFTILTIRAFKKPKGNQEER